MSGEPAEPRSGSPLRRSPSGPPSEHLDELVVRMDERAALAQISERLDAGEDPAVLVEECRTGMERVGRLYEDGTYYISALIMAGEIIREAAELLVPRMEASRSDNGGGKMVIATVRGDIHDIGKNMVIALLDADGFMMVDLGVNVPPEQVAAAVERERPDVLGLSCLLTSGYEALRETIDLVRRQSSSWHPHLPVVLGGAAVDAMVKERLGADAWCVDAARGLGVVKALLA